ncbi:MAG: aminotransferase class V-fold PLP-dependent enzyme, partial [Actinomycetia bacterium]|nr:aminotransferase class V-fold PLP-dependent enzyme [Actinomycetes bacterium]
MHLNHGSFGACPVEVLDLQGALRAEMEANPVAFMLRRYQSALEDSRQALAAFVGADAAGLVFVPNATYGVNSALRSIEGRLRPGAELVITSHTYNACRNAVVVTAERAGATVVVADIPFPIAEPDEAVAAVVDVVTERTALVVIDHVTSPTGLCLPIEEIIAAIDPSVMVLVDGAHAPGMLDVDLSALGASFYTANCHKWICAPKGAAFLWVADPFRQSAIPASISHGYNDGWPGSGSRFHAQFDWTGTDDPTARLCVGRALEAMAAHRSDGWPGSRVSNREPARAGRRVILDALGAAPPAPESMIGSIASVLVPPDRKPSPGIF